MTKYIRTIVSGKNTVLGLEGCNKCPFFRIKERQATCIKYHNTSYGEVSTVFIKGGVVHPTKPFPIPSFCELPKVVNSYNSEFMKVMHYVDSNGTVKTKTPPDNVVRILVDKFVLFGGVNGYELIRNTEKIKNNNNIGINKVIIIKVNINRTMLYNCTFYVNNRSHVCVHMCLGCTGKGEGLIHEIRQKTNDK